MSAALGAGVICGTALGVGLWSLVSLTPRLSRPRLIDRVAPYVLDLSAEARRIVGRRSVDPIPVLGTLFTPAFESLRRGFSAALGGADTIERRLRQAGSTQSVDAFRSVQLVWALLFGAGGIVLAVTVPRFRELPLAAQLMLPLLTGATGALLRDVLLRRAAAKRLARITGELPTTLEFLTLSLSAGEGILDSLRRVSATSTGDLSRELAGVVAEVHSGVSLAAALESLDLRIRLPEVTRFVDQLSGALDRGSPLADVLRAQAQDAREQSKRRLLELAGKKEVTMLVPVVFLILPLTILFAVFPGFFVLQSGF